MLAKVTVEGPTCVRAGVVDGTWKGSSAGAMDVLGRISWESTPMYVT